MSASCVSPRSKLQAQVVAATIKLEHLVAKPEFNITDAVMYAHRVKALASLIDINHPVIMTMIKFIERAQS